MAFIMGTIIIAKPESKKFQIIGAAIGGLFQIIGYTLAKILLIGVAPALMSIPNISIQTLIGIVLFVALSAALSVALNKFMNKRGF